MSYGPHLVRVDVCCNDPDNGSFDGRAAAIQLQDQLLEIAASDFRGPVFRDNGSTIKISRRLFAYDRSKEWIGNWCWNAYWLDVDVAVAMLAYVHGLRAFDVEQGEERLFSRWRWSESLTASDLDLLGRLMVKADLNEGRQP